jgi:hypothetical protein
MPYIFHFSPEAMSSQQYDEITRRLEAAGLGAPEGRIHHTAYGSAEAIRVFDVWESPEVFERFGPILMPILQDVGVDPGTPEVAPVHNLIAG